MALGSSVGSTTRQPATPATRGAGHARRPRPAWPGSVRARLPGARRARPKAPLAQRRWLRRRRSGRSVTSLTRPARAAIIPTPRGPAVHLRDVEYIASAPKWAQSRCAKACAASTISGMPSSRHVAATRADGLDDAAVTAQRREVHQRGRIGRQDTGRGVDVEAPDPSTGSSRTSNPCRAMTKRFGPYSPGRQATVRSPRASLPSRTSRAWLAPVVKTTSPAANPVRRREGRPAGVEHRRGGFRRDVSTDFRLVPRVPGRGVDHGEGLPRAGGAVEVHSRDRRPGRPPGSSPGSLTRE